ncbi:MAG: 50S ribosomal protein L4 [Nanoarchaeota archaeon]
MKIPIYDGQNIKTGEIELPKYFDEPINDDLIKSSVNIMRLSRRHPYGSDPLAGKKSAAKLSRRRRKFKTSYGIGISRVPRKIMSRSGTRFNWVGAFAPGTVGGRRAHPPKALKVLEKKLNDKEKRKAMFSALAATMSRESVKRNGYILPDSYPFALDGSIEGITKTKEAIKLLSTIGFSNELERASIKKIRAGRGKMRGRKYRKKKSLLLVVSEGAAINKAIKNIPGVDCVYAGSLSIMDLAPASRGGRLTLFTKPAVEKLAAKVSK